MSIFFFTRYYLLEKLLIPRFYPITYGSLSERNRRSFVNHHLAGATKIILCLWTAYPFVSVAFGESNLSTPLHKGSIPSKGDAMLVASQIFVGMYLTELLYRSELSIVAVGHHIGAAVIAESAVAISLNAVREKDATIEFVLCFFWGESHLFFRPSSFLLVHIIWERAHNFLFSRLVH